jgi:predicted NAD/FAD-binding protein
VSLTYWMNSLQGIDRRYPLFVSINPERRPAEGTVFRSMSYAHPVFDAEALDAQRRIGRIQGRGGIWYAGAWLGYGFHEDGMRSGLDVAHALGVRPPWEAPVRENVVPARAPASLPDRAVASPER